MSVKPIEALAAADSDIPPTPAPTAKGNFGGLSLRLRLLLLLALAILPALIAGSVTALTRYEAGLNETRVSLRALSLLAVNRQLETLAETSRLLQTLAKLPEVVALDPQRCPAELARQHTELAQRYTNIVAVDLDGLIPCSALPLERGRRFSDPTLLAAVQQRKAFIIGGIIVGAMSGERLLSASAPITTPDGRIVGMLTTGIKATFLDSQFDVFQLPEGSKLALVDRSGRPLLNDASKNWRLPDAPAITAAIAAGEREMQHRLDGESYQVMLNQIGDYDVFVLSALPSHATTNLVTSRLLTDLGEMLAFVLLAGIGVLVGAQLLVLGPIARFRRAVQAYRRDGAGFSFGGAPIEIAELAQEFGSMASEVEARQDNMKALLRQRDLLVRETNHRVKNNLQIVASLLSLQSRRISEPAARMQFDLARQRVATLALLHRHLYEQRDTETVNLRSFFTQLVAQLLSAYGQRARSSVSVVDIRVPPSVAIPLGLIVTEAVTNAMKHAFPERQGHLDLTVSVESNRGLLVLRDDGIGPGNGNADRSGMGDILMRGFADQVSGTLRVDEPPGGGTRVTLDFDLGEPPERADAPDDTIVGS